MIEEKPKKAKINDFIKDAMEKIKSLANAETIIGDPILTKSGKTIIPISKAVIGFVVGGGEYDNPRRKDFPIEYPMAGGSGGGMNLVPIGFIVEDEKEVKYIPLTNNTANLEKILNIASKICDAITAVKESEK